MSLINYLKPKETDNQSEVSSGNGKQSVEQIISDLMDVAYVHVEITYRKIFKKKLFGIFNIYTNIPVYRLVYVTPSKIKANNSYEEYNTHAELYTRLVTQPIYGQPFPSNIRVNEFIDLGFTLLIQ